MRLGFADEASAIVVVLPSRKLVFESLRRPRRAVRIADECADRRLVVDRLRGHDVLLSVMEKQNRRRLEAGGGDRSKRQDRRYSAASAKPAGVSSSASVSSACTSDSSDGASSSSSGSVSPEKRPTQAVTVSSGGANSALG